MLHFYLGGELSALASHLFVRLALMLIVVFPTWVSSECRTSGSLDDLATVQPHYVPHYFSVRVKPDVLQQRILAVQQRKDVEVETEGQITREYAQKIADSLPSTVIDISPRQVAQSRNTWLTAQVNKRGSEIIIQAECDLPNTETAATAAFVFSIISGRDLNQDGNLSLGSELQGSVFVSTVSDAIKLAQGDDLVTPTEALRALREKAGRVAVAYLSICYQAQ